MVDLSVPTFPWTINMYTEANTQEKLRVKVQAERYLLAFRHCS
jgi:hypothetical protein